MAIFKTIDSSSEAKKLDGAPAGIPEDVQKLIKPKRDILSELIRANLEVFGRAQIMEKYYTRKVVAGNKAFEIPLGSTQRNMREQKELIAFLCEELKNL